ncbi:TlpA family protein disulfide reductase [Actinokineospora guangxiensis]|uniref:TlpA family protein disulfide reductase n=1 Tax=Actinokineospora guangxiensis TaxID=1490288 RepID=A0ABW0ETT7_9PSEU
MIPRVRWLVVVAVLGLAAAVALWPRGDEPAPRTPPPGPDVAAARAAAGLPGCADAAEGPQQLRGVTTTCLGTGGPVDAAAALGGRDVLLNVWATWCQPCKEELPLLAEYDAGEGIDVVTLAVQSGQGDALVLLRALGVRLESLIDEDGSVAAALRVPNALPASYLLKADGTVSFIGEPRLFRTVADIRTAVAEGLA